MARIAITDDYQKVARTFADWSRLEAAHEIVVFDKPFAGQDEAADRLAPFDVLGIMRERTAFPRTLIERLPNLKLIVTTGLRNASVDTKAAAERGIKVCGTEGGNHATAELAMGLILGLARNFHIELRNMQEGRWQTTIGQDLKGKTLGVLGLGRLGGGLANYARAFGMDIIAWSQNLTDEKAREKGVTRVEKDELFRRSDFVSIHLVLSDRSRGLVGARELGLMKPTASIVNTSRGPIIDGAALLDALKSGRIAGAALDVYDVEPLPAAHALRSEPRALLTPHIGYVTAETYQLFFAGMVEAIEGYLAGKPVRVIV
ncbi:MAG: D-2-hydroxyacid dehydrogenase family protein [Hyphomicrobiaceae bacterium]|nr:D-2-hydroxyacid dehydrogenase family protein [Hyphomicrobiaceae bacterium]